MMKLNQNLNHWAMLGAVSAMLTIAAPAVYASAPVLLPPGWQSSAIAAKPEGMMMKTGKFVAAEKATTGTARIVQEKGHYYLELDSAFSTSELGPDLHVLLDSQSKPPQSYTAMNGYVNLGKLHSYSGMQRYPIPDAINVSKVKSVVIWCRMANATFGYASL